MPYTADLTATQIDICEGAADLEALMPLTTGYGIKRQVDLGDEIQSRWTTLDPNTSATVGYAGVGSSKTRIECYLGAFFRFLLRLEACSLITDPALLQQCMDDAQGYYDGDIAECNTPA